MPVIPQRPTLSTGAANRLQQFMEREGLDDINEAIVLMAERCQCPAPAPRPSAPSSSLASLF